MYSNFLRKHLKIESKGFSRDMVAKAPSSVVVQFNSYYGCIGIHRYSTHSCIGTFTCKVFIKISAIFILVMNLSLFELQKGSANTADRKEIVNGVRGRCFPDEIIEIPYDILFDAMHQVFLSCGKLIRNALVRSLTKRDQLTVEYRLKNIKSPRESHGKPKLLSEMM